MVILLARGDVDRCSQFTRQRGGAGRRGCCCCSIYSKTPWLFTFVHFSLCCPTEVHQDHVSASLSRIAVIEQQRFFCFTLGLSSSSQGDSQVNTGKKCWMSLGEKEEAISGFSLKNELSFAAAFSWGKWFPVFFCPIRTRIPVPTALARVRMLSWGRVSNSHPAAVRRRQKRNSQTALSPPSASPPRPVLCSSGSRLTQC